MKKNKESEFYIKNNQENVIDVFFSREELIKHLSSMVLVYNNNIFIKTKKEN